MLTEQHVKEEDQFGMISNTQQGNTNKPDLVTYKFELDDNFIQGDIKVLVELICCSRIQC